MSKGGFRDGRRGRPTSPFSLKFYIFLWNYQKNKKYLYSWQVGKCPGHPFLNFLDPPPDVKWQFGRIYLQTYAMVYELGISSLHHVFPELEFKTSQLKKRVIKYKIKISPVYLHTSPVTLTSYCITFYYFKQVKNGTCAHEPNPKRPELIPVSLV